MTEWFDALGLAYGKRFAELNEAQAVFEEQRKRVEDHLIVQLRREHPGAPAPRAEKPCWISFEVDGEYKKARDRVRRSGASSYGFAIGSPPGAGLDGALGFVPFVYFAMGKSMQRRIPPDAIAALTRVENGRLTLTPGIIAFGTDGFPMSELEESVRALPALFARLDAILASVVPSATDD